MPPLDRARSCYEASLGPDQPDARSIYRVKASLARVARVQARFTNLSRDRRRILDGAIALLGDGQRYLDREADRDDFHLSHMAEGMLWADRAEAGGGREDILRATSCYDVAGVVITAERFPIQYAELLRERGRAARIAWQLTRDERRRTRAMELIQTSLDLLPAPQLPRHGRLAEQELALLRADAR